MNLGYFQSPKNADTGIRVSNPIKVVGSSAQQKCSYISAHCMEKKQESLRRRKNSTQLQWKVVGRIAQLGYSIRGQSFKCVELYLHLQLYLDQNNCLRKASQNIHYLIIQFYREISKIHFLLYVLPVMTGQFIGPMTYIVGSEAFLITGAIQVQDKSIKP